MKKAKVLVISIVVLMTVSISAPAQTPSFMDLQRAMSDFSMSLARSLPFNSSFGLNWSDAYIGRLFPSAPPRFGVGAAIGFTTMDRSTINTLSSYLGYEMPFDSDRLFMPAYTVEARIGGFFLPFDMGFKVGVFPPNELLGSGLRTNHFLAGWDIRYAIVDGRSNRLLPNVSLGFGINYLRGNFDTDITETATISYTLLGVPRTIALNDTVINMNWDTISMDLKAQISRSFLIFTPYLGVAGSFARSNAGYSVDARITMDGTPVRLDPLSLTLLNLALDFMGIDDIEVRENGIFSSVSNSAFSYRVFGGVSVNLAAFRLDFTGLYNILDGNFGASLGFRFQM